MATEDQEKNEQKKSSEIQVDIEKKTEQKDQKKTSAEKPNERVSRPSKSRKRERDNDRPDDGIMTEVVRIARCAKVMKGGRRFSFSALVVAGDGAGKIGWGYGKAPGVPAAIEKATKKAKHNMFCVNIKDGTIPHKVIGRLGSSKVVMLPASKGTGVIAGAAVRAVVTCAGIHDILTKSLGSNNSMNLVKATFDGISKLKASKGD